MKILLVHNAYRRPSGEAQVIMAERDLLLQRGHEVVLYERSSAEISQFSLLEFLSLPINVIWSRRTFREICEILRRERPDLAHFHNIFPLISPAAYHACKDTGVPVVQTLHNYRLLCPATTLARDGMICELCVGRKLALPAIQYGCYHHSRPQTLVAAAKLSLHHGLKTWDEKVDLYIALTEFGRAKFIEGGINPEKIVVKPNYLPMPRVDRTGDAAYALFVGRVVEHKGVQTLLQAWHQHDDIPLKLVGEGPLLEAVQAAEQAGSLGEIEALGKTKHEDVLALMRGARFLVFPSQWYEGLPMTILEAFACGTPVLASNLGAMAEVVEDGVTGLLFNPGDPNDLAAKVRWAWSHPGEMARMGQAALRTYEEKYSAARNYDMLMAIYDRAIEDAHARRCSA